ncbi:MAG: hypothetical protein WCS92_04720 [Candidatus Babeliales bacterium]
MEISCNNQTEQFELLSNKSLEECLMQSSSDNNSNSCFNGNSCFCDGSSCNRCDDCYGLGQ